MPSSIAIPTAFAGSGISLPADDIMLPTFNPDLARNLHWDNEERAVIFTCQLSSKYTLKANASDPTLQFLEPMVYPCDVGLSISYDLGIKTRISAATTGQESISAFSSSDWSSCGSTLSNPARDSAATAHINVAISNFSDIDEEDSFENSPSLLDRSEDIVDEPETISGSHMRYAETVERHHIVWHDVEKASELSKLITAGTPKILAAKNTSRSSLKSRGKKARRYNRPPHNHAKTSTFTLKEWFTANISSPFPCEDAKKQLAKKSGLSIVQVSTWFVNERKRVLKPLRAAAGLPQLRNRLGKEFLPV